jgi:hypothetical protein
MILLALTMPRPNQENPAEEFLYRNNLISKRSAAQRLVLGCIGCRWVNSIDQGKEPEFYGLEVVRCSGMGSGTVYTILGRLAEAGVILKEREDIDPPAPARPARQLYYPVASDDGVEFAEKLIIPNECYLEPQNSAD